jgi:glycosyltransferase involved in cell wall biosynthesis
MNKQRIYFDCRQYGNSGIGTYIENLINQFQQNPASFEFHLLARKEHKDFLSSKLKFQINEYNGTIYSIKEQFSWVAKIDPRGILHVPHYNAPLLYPGRLVITVHDVCHLAMRQFFPGLLKQMYSSTFFKRILNKSNHIITVSEFSKSEIMKYFDIDSNKISVIYNGVSEIFHPVEKSESDRILNSLNLPQEYILFLGNIKPHKNIVGVLSSYRKALQREKDLPPLLVLGNNQRMEFDIPEIKMFLSDSQLKDKLIFTGYLPTEVLPSVYSRALLFLFPSYYEGFGLTVLEAMACGTPVITSNCSAIPEIVGHSAILVNPYDNDEIADQIIRLAADSALQVEMIKRGFRQVQLYSWSESALKHLEIYQKLGESSAVIRKKPNIESIIKNKKNILFLDQYGDRIGGGQVILLDILEKFRSSGDWEVFVSVPEAGRFTELLWNHGFKAAIVKSWQPIWHQDIRVSDAIKYLLSSIKSSYFIGRYIRKNKIDVVYCNGGRTFLNGTFLSLLFSLKLFFHLHLLLEEKQKRAVTILGRSPGVKKIFAVSSLLEKQYSNHSVYKKICIVSNWVSPELLIEKRELRPDVFDLPVRIGIVGQISKIKGQWTVLKALFDAKFFIPISLSLFGEPLQHDTSHWKDITDMIADLNMRGWNVQYQGFKSNKLEIYDTIDVLIIPSLVPESFGLTAIEAMAREVIVVANRSGALVEIIDNMVNGLLYDIHNSSELFDILVELSENRIDVKAMRKAGLITVQTNYHPQKQLELLHRIVYRAVNDLSRSS